MSETRLYGVVTKGWGSEHIFVSNDLYCGKLLHFDTGAKFSMHFHAKKHETWLVLSGVFMVRVINTMNAEVHQQELHQGDVWINEPLEPHQIICIEAGTIIEVSTPDSVEDNFRVEKGDSQL